MKSMILPQKAKRLLFHSAIHLCTLWRVPEFLFSNQIHWCTLLKILGALAYVLGTPIKCVVLICINKEIPIQTFCLHLKFVPFGLVGVA